MFRIDLPEKFVRTTKELLGEEYDDFLQSYQRPVYSGIRMNTLKITPEAFMKLTGREMEQVAWNELGFYCDQAKTFSRSPLYYAGLYYIQEPSAMLPAHLLPVREGDRVLDMCAAPGGKSTALAAKLQGTGLLVSNDISYSRAKALLRNMEAFGVKNSLVISEDPAKLVKRLPQFFDKILIDAPCSGEGMFHKKPSMTAAWEKNGPEFYSAIQRGIICHGADMLRPGGDMVFSTCTFSPLEDEGTIAYFLEKHPEFELVREIRLWPHKVKGEGHYVTLLHKRTKGELEELKERQDLKEMQELKALREPVSDPSDVYVYDESGSYVPYAYKRAKGTESFFEFLKEAEISLDFDPQRLLVQGDHLYYLPEGMMDISGMRLLRCGWYLGNIKKNRFEPSGAFAVGLKSCECGKKIELDYRDPDAVKYLKCETLEVADTKAKGWHLVCVNGYPLGWGKLSGGTLKNKYPAGWRWQS